MCNVSYINVLTVYPVYTFLSFMRDELRTNPKFTSHGFNQSQAVCSVSLQSCGSQPQG